MTSAHDTLPPDDSRDPFEALAEEFAELIRVGEQPSVDEFADQHPQMADQIRELFPLIVQFEQPKFESDEPAEIIEQSDLERKHRTDDEAGETQTYTDLDDSESGDSSRIGSDVEIENEHDRVGRYELQRLLGEGGFGRVYLAFDEQLQRSVAIKMPGDSIRHRIDANEFIREARIVAQLEHPAIVPVYDVGQTADGLVYIVSRFIPGLSLADRIADRQLSHNDSVRIVECIADGLHLAHSKGLVHRDIKPANILLDDHDVPFLTDFGIALSDQDLVDSIRHAGTPRYMSPEQARGEGHLIDGRSDIFSLGIVLHELLTGVTPFRGKTPRDVLKRIINSRARPLRQFDASIPIELERVCLRALEKHAADRYSTAIDFADDLRAFLAGHSANKTSMQVSTLTSAPQDLESSDRLAPSPPVVPKGLVAFDQNDADFFLQLLPGPHDRLGMPECIRFWKHLMENRDVDTAVRIGTVYGPSGCGKSSLIRAGVLPRLDQGVESVLVSASVDLVAGLTDSIVRRWPELRPKSTDASDRCADTLLRLRREIAPRSGRKIVIVIDQFEQFLHAAGETKALADALRQCDGANLQAILIVRVDYWLGLTRFIQQLEPRQLDARNSRMVDLFDRRHAKNVLETFGRAFGALPASQLSENQKRFLDDAIDQLQTNDKVIAVRLSLFAEMTKDKPWDLATLRQMGGVDGIGLRFLEETIGDRTVNPDLRRHRNAVRDILTALLPDDSGELKGDLRSEEQLLHACGYADREDEFAIVLRILNSELRLITPVDRQEWASNAQASARRDSDTGDLYQLAHDFLVPAIREWLTLQQRSTPDGRARLALAEHAGIWKRKPMPAFLPNLPTYCAIRGRVPRQSWTSDERRMMKAADQRHMRRLTAWCGLGILLCTIVLGATAVWNRIRGRDHAAAYLSSSAEQLPITLDRLEPYLRNLDGTLEEVDTSNPPRRMRADLALLRSNPQRATDLARYMITTENEIEFNLLVDSLRPHHDRVLPICWSALADPSLPDRAKLHAAIAVALYDGEESTERFQPFSASIARPLIRTLGNDKVDQLRPLGLALVPELWSYAVDPKHDPELQSEAVDLLLEYAAPPSVFGFLIESPRRHVRQVIGHVASHRDVMLPITLQAVENLTDPRKLAMARLVAFRLGRFDKALPALEDSNDPIVRSYFVSLIPLCGVDASRIFRQIQSEADPTILHGLIVALAECRDSISAEDRADWGRSLMALHREHADSGVHAACEYLLRVWDVPSWKDNLAGMETTTPQTNDSSWFVNSQGQTFVVIKAGEFEKGSSPEFDPYHLSHEELRTVKLNRTIAVGTTPVTMEQFNKSVNIASSPKYKGFGLDAPICKVSWYDAAAYCNWLSEQEGIPAEEWCYLTNTMQRYAHGMRIAPHSFERKGYRLLTESEWEYACRAGRPPVVNRYYGSADDLLGEYAWHKNDEQAVEKPMPVGLRKPNQIGLFDMLGNVHEWTNTHRYRGQTAEVRNGMDMLMRGGSFATELKYVRNACPYFEAAHVISQLYGFRIARTLDH